MAVTRTDARWFALALVALMGCGGETNTPTAPVDGVGTPPPVPGNGGAGNGSVPPSTGTDEPLTSFGQIERCIGMGSGQQADCMDAFIHEYATKFSKDTPALLADLEAARLTHPQVESFCHSIAHAVGRELYRSTMSVPDSFDTCDETCHSGCYHGVMERVFTPSDGNAHANLEDVKAAMPTVCATEQFENPTSALVFQCYHGLGHAVVFSLGYNLEGSMEACGMAPTAVNQADCRGGAFMENASGVEPALRDLDPSDPHYPCNKFEGQIQAECYGMQTSVMVEFGLTTEQIAEECRHAGDGTETHPSVLACMRSIGRDMSGHARSDNPEPLRVACEDLTTAEPHSRECIYGAVAALIDNSWDGRFALPFCNFLHGDPLRATCYGLSRSHLVNAYGFDREGWLSQCTSYAGDQQAVCEAAFPAPSPAP